MEDIFFYTPRVPTGNTTSVKWFFDMPSQADMETPFLQPFLETKPSVMQWDSNLQVLKDNS